jgi:multimeric flavodoxin WrbA
MKIVSIIGSHRKNGNTEMILKGFDKEFKAMEIPDYRNKIYNISEMNIYPCRSCNKCKKRNNCIIEDDFGKVALKMIQSDLIIMGSPVYFSDVSAQIKALFDRTYSLWHKKMLKGKNIILVATCAEYGSGHTIDTMRHWARDHEMNIIATVEGKCEKKGKVLENEMTVKAIADAVRACDLIMPKTKPEDPTN